MRMLLQRHVVPFCCISDAAWMTLWRMTIFLKQKHSVGVDGCRGIRKVDAERCLAASNEDQGRTLSAMAIFDSPAT